MGHWWRHALGLIAVVTGGALAIMSWLGSFETFSEPWLQWGAAIVGSVADIGIVALLLGFQDFRHKRRQLALTLAIVFWAAFSIYTVIQGETWLQHALETAQQPGEQQEKTERDRQNNLARERAFLDKQDETALTGKTEDVRKNAAKMAAETRARIAKLEGQDTFQAKTERAPKKSPLAGYEWYVALVLWAASQGCWHMAYGEAAEEATGAESGTARKPEQAEIAAGNDAPASPRKQRKRAGNNGRKSTGTKPGNEESAQIIQFRRRPTREEVLAFLESDGGKNQKEAAAHFGYSDRHIRNILNENSGLEKCQVAG